MWSVLSPLPSTSQHPSLLASPILAPPNLTGPSTANKVCRLSDEVKLLSSLVQSHEFVQSVTFTRGRHPVVYLYTPDQISDVRRMCCVGATQHMRTALRITCALPTPTPYLLTVTAFSNRTLSEAGGSGAANPPLFIGPMMLHSDNTFEAYHAFLSHLNSALDSHVAATELSICDDVPDGLIEEQPVAKAVYRAFYTGKHAFCLRHCAMAVRQRMAALDITDAALRDDVHIAAV